MVKKLVQNVSIDTVGVKLKGRVFLGFFVLLYFQKKKEKHSALWKLLSYCSIIKWFLSLIGTDLTEYSIIMKNMISGVNILGLNSDHATLDRIFISFKLLFHLKNKGDVLVCLFYKVVLIICISQMGSVKTEVIIHIPDIKVLLSK